MPVIHVSADRDRNYDVIIERGSLIRCGELLSPLVSGNKIAVITDSNVEALYLPAVRTSLERGGYEVCTYAFPAGEESKNIETLSDILEFLAENRLTRFDFIVALGGGVVGDIAGFAAGCYLRGIGYAQIPTTLLAFVDSSVGGKTAVDLRSGKNLAGLFYPPAAVIADYNCLGTLPGNIFADGAAEVIKTGILSGEPLFSLAERCQIKRNAENIIAMCISYKAKIVGSDEFERGPRKLLNLGHTIAHAIEKLSDYTVSHGQAVAAGTAIISRAALAMGILPPSEYSRIDAALRACGLPVGTKFGAPELAEAAIADKKRSGESITLVIPRKIGQCELVETPICDLKAIIEKGLKPPEAVI